MTKPQQQKSGYLKIYHTPEAEYKRQAYEYFRIIDINADGVLCDKGEKRIVFLPWPWVRGYEHEFY